MTQYRKKPDVIEAWPVRELNRAAGHEWKALPQSMRDAYRQGGWVFGVFKTDNDATNGRGIYIPTLAGSLWAAPEDMVIRGVNGEFYPCKPDIFAASYEPVEQPMTPADPIPPPVTPEPLSAEELDGLSSNLQVGWTAAVRLRLIAQARAAARPSPWQDIGTAPKDGTRVLIGWEEDGVWQQRCAYWDADFTSDWNEDANEAIHIGEWTDGAVLSFGYEETKCYKPTRWQPLPAPPAQDGGRP